MQTVPVGIIGASGYSGLEASRILALHPLVDSGLLVRERVIADAASGVTGAGRRASEEYSFAEIDGDFRAYKVLGHQHQPEMAQSIGLPLTFTPHLLPIKRGILATCYGRLAGASTAAALRTAFLHKYADCPFVEVLESPDEVTV